MTIFLQEQGNRLCHLYGSLNPAEQFMSCDTSLTKFVPPHKIENGYMTSWLKLGECLKKRAN